MKEVWKELLNELDPLLLKAIIGVGVFLLLIILHLLYVFS